MADRAIREGAAALAGTAVDAALVPEIRTRLTATSFGAAAAQGAAQ